MHTSRKKLVSPLVTLSSIVALAGSATFTWAESMVLEEIVVEAQKKVETVTETPMTINAISGEQFEKYASFNFQDVARTTPALSFDVGVTPDIRMRGVSTVTLAAVSLRTTIYQDGALIEQPRTIFDPQYDIERFEVLKGPQGTLYGKSSPTGAINIRTKNPSLSETDGYLSGSIGQRDLINTQFGVSVPIIEDQLAVRVAAIYDDNETYGTENVATGREAHSRASGTRVTFLWEPSDNFSGRFSYQYREKKDNPFYTNDGAGFDFRDDKLNTNLNDSNNYIDQLSILELNYGINDNLSIVSVTAYQEQSFDNYQDIDGVIGSVNPGTGPGQSLVGSEQFTNAEISPQIQEDLRLISEDNDIWDWQMGLYYQRTGSLTNVNVTTYNASALSYLDVNTTLLSIQENYALYTHNTFKINDDFNIIAGLRYQQSRRFTSQPTVVNTKNGGLLREVNGIPANIRTLMTYPVTGTLKAQYFFSPDLVAYATVDRAFRGGGANVDISNNLPSDFSEISEESANSAEIGLKGTFEDQRGRFAISAFDQIYKNFQQDFQNVTINAFPPLVQNMVQSAKEAETRGLELSLAWLLQESWSVEFNTAFTDSKFTDFDGAIASLDAVTNTSVCGSQPAPGKNYATCDLSGERLPLASRWSGNVASEYSLPAFGSTDWYLNALFNFQSDQVDKVTRDTLGGYSTLDLFTGLRGGEDSTWDVNFWVKNVFDRRVITRVFKAGIPVSGVAGTEPTFNQVNTNLPRQIGVTGSYRF